MLAELQGRKRSLIAVVPANLVFVRHIGASGGDSHFVLLLPRVLGSELVLRVAEVAHDVIVAIKW